MKDPTRRTAISIGYVGKETMVFWCFLGAQTGRRKPSPSLDMSSPRPKVWLSKLVTSSSRQKAQTILISAPEMWSHMVTFLVTFNHQKSIRVPQWEREQVWAVPGALGEILSWGRAVVLVVQFLSLPDRQGTRWNHHEWGNAETVLKHHYWKWT